MRFIKAFLRKSFVIRSLAWLIASYIKFVFKTTRWEYINLEPVDALLQRKTSLIFCFWHNRLMMMSCVWTWDVKFHMLISAHRDGLLIAETIRHFGINTVEGSSSRGGLKAVRHLMNVLKKGSCIGLTPDGPRGPRFKAQAGVIQLAKLGGNLIVPASYSITRRKVINSWDKLIFPLPFGRGVFICGEPISVSKTSTDEELQRQLIKIQESLCYISNLADEKCGHMPLSSKEGK